MVGRGGDLALEFSRQDVDTAADALIGYYTRGRRTGDPLLVQVLDVWARHENLHEQIKNQRAHWRLDRPGPHHRPKQEAAYIAFAAAGSLIGLPYLLQTAACGRPA